MKNKKKTTPAAVIKKIISAVITVVFIFTLVVFGALVFQKITGKQSKLLQYNFYYIVTDSMSGEFEFDGEIIALEAGEVIVSRVVTDQNAAELLVPGAVVSYIVPSGTLQGMTLTHRVEQGIYLDEELGVYCIRTRGTKSGATLDSPVPIANVKGAMVAELDFLTKLYNALTSRVGFLCMIILPFGLLLVLQVVRLVLQLKKKTPTEKTREEREREIAEKAVAEFILKRKAIEEFKAANPEIAAKEKGGENETEEEKDGANKVE